MTRLTHGHASRSVRGGPTAEYRIWCDMRQRCAAGRKNYGARGIRVCGRWDSFANFLTDMGPRPSPRHSIDRKDVNGNYEPLARQRRRTSTFNANTHEDSMSAQPQKQLAKPVDWDELFPGRFLKAGDFKGKKVTLTMIDIKIEELVGDKGPQIKGVIGFKETEKQWALNKTNGLCLREMFGRKVQEWNGKRVTLFPDTWDGELCIRVWGSPDVEADKEITIQLPRKRPFKKTMHKVGAPAAVKSTLAEPPPADDDFVSGYDSAQQ